MRSLVHKQPETKMIRLKIHKRIFGPLAQFEQFFVQGEKLLSSPIRWIEKQIFRVLKPLERWFLHQCLNPENNHLRRKNSEACRKNPKHCGCEQRFYGIAVVLNAIGSLAQLSIGWLALRSIPILLEFWHNLSDTFDNAGAFVAARISARYHRNLQNENLGDHTKEAAQRSVERKELTLRTSWVAFGIFLLLLGIGHGMWEIAEKLHHPERVSRLAVIVVIVGLIVNDLVHALLHHMSCDFHTIIRDQQMWHTHGDRRQSVITLLVLLIDAVLHTTILQPLAAIYIVCYVFTIAGLMAARVGKTLNEVH